MIKYLVVYEKTKTGYSAYAPDLPGVAATGKTKRVVKKNIFSAIQFHIKGLQEDKIKLPKNLAESEVFEFVV